MQLNEQKNKIQQNTIYEKQQKDVSLFSLHPFDEVCVFVNP